MASSVSITGIISILQRSLQARAYVTQNIVDQDSPSGDSPMISANRLVRTHMLGGVGRDG
jgi:hypothetical protein